MHFKQEFFVTFYEACFYYYSLHGINRTIMSVVYEKDGKAENDSRERVLARLEEQQELGPVHVNKVLVIGLGQLGLPVAKYVKERGLDVYGYDISSGALERAEKANGIKKATSFSGFDVYIICVSTHKQEDMFSPQIEGIMSIVDKISREAKSGALVSIESTIPRGTSKKVFEMLNHRLHVVHVPHRWYALEEMEHGVNQLRVIGGVHDCCLRVALQFYTGDGNNNSGSEININGNNNSSSNNDNEIRNLGIPLHP